jgi:hypothetical protein
MPISSGGPYHDQIYAFCMAKRQRADLANIMLRGDQMKCRASISDGTRAAQAQGVRRKSTSGSLSSCCQSLGGYFQPLPSERGPKRKKGYFNRKEGLTCAVGSTRLLTCVSSYTGTRRKRSDAWHGVHNAIGSYRLHSTSPKRITLYWGRSRPLTFVTIRTWPMASKHRKPNLS